MMERATHWNRRCPPHYRDTDIHRIPVAYRRIIDNWHYGPKGFALIGEAGTGKTRAAFEVLRRQHMLGMRWTAITAVNFAEHCAHQFSENKQTKKRAEEILQHIRFVPLLLLDDLGQNKMSERVEVELYALFNVRKDLSLPVIWTANSTGEELLTMFSTNRGEPIMRRLAELSL